MGPDVPLDVSEGPEQAPVGTLFNLHLDLPKPGRETTEGAGCLVYGFLPGAEAHVTSLCAHSRPRALENPGHTVCVTLGK